MSAHKSPEENEGPVGGAVDDPRLPDLIWVRRTNAENELLLEVEKRVRRRARRRWRAVAGTLTVLMVAGASWSLLHREAGEGASALKTVTRVTSPTKQMLPDGSLIELRDGAQVEVRYDETLRRVILEKGEAHFIVAKNLKPFVVETGGVTVKAVGTAFSVQRDAARVEVLVTEGKVQFERQSAPGASLADAPPPHRQAPAELIEIPVLAAGQRGVYRSGVATAEISEVSEKYVAQQLSWRKPMLEFFHTPLAEVIALMNQHAVGVNKVHFVLASPELGETRLSGFLRSDNSEGLVELLEKDFGIRSERSGETIRLRKIVTD
jgi:transmembrane sensor